MHDCKETYNGVPCTWHDPEIPVSHNSKTVIDGREMLLTWTYADEARASLFADELIGEVRRLVKA